ncbi:pyridoxamine 5'-phosphate oxidase family protein [Ramlibacter sp. AW1]|uniref:Pyridoxamine 5'-phosphate oxidase family protein n=1 Tax=Ramlibacter aurantiacus TaxID=2801330 RepID=A0A936ZMA6_9BURK|nr:pyridoxamine 5'-phosphate oxidase family protein [Ramlibacter aurantiacus]MBL0418781.1 pyridoxamine 5'-phosphate oxidase family protein [Ramlibacter aurantiacus]
MTDAAQVRLSAEQAHWVQGPLSVVVGTCGSVGRPHAARAVGCCVSPDRGSVTVVLQASTATQSLDDLRSDRRIAVVFSDPLTHHSLQVKGTAERIEPAGPAGRELSQLWVRAFAHRLKGTVPDTWTPEALAGVMLTGAADDLFFVTVRLRAIFDQTPGPAAGAAVGTHAN